MVRTRVFSKREFISLKRPKKPRGYVCGPVQSFAANECNKLQCGADRIKRSEQHRDSSEGSCSRTVKLSVERQIYSYYWANMPLDSLSLFLNVV